MADYKKYQSDGVSAEDKALDKFAELMRLCQNVGTTSFIF